MVYRRDRVVWGAVLFRTTNPEVVEGAIVRRSDRLHWTSEARIARHIGREDRRETAGLAHVASPAAKRRPDRNSSRSAGLRNCAALGTICGVIARSRVTIARASSRRPIWA